VASIRTKMRRAAARLLGLRQYDVARVSRQTNERNNGLFRRMIQMHVGYTVGRGFPLQSNPRNIGGALDQIASDIIERNFRRWATAPVSLDGNLNLVGVCKLAVRTWKRDGEVFLRPVVRDGKLKIQALEGDYVPEWITDDNPVVVGDRRAVRTINGIAIDADGSPVAYYMTREHPGDRGTTFGSHQRGHSDSEPVPASDVLHLFEPERPGQLRGMPIGCSSANDLRMLKGYFSAELMAARANASRPVSVEQEKDADGQYRGDSEGADGEIQLDLREGGASILPAGWSMKWSPVQHPSGTFDSYVNAVTRHLAASWNVSHALLTRNLSEVNYSSLRIESTDCARYFADLQDVLDFKVLTPIFLKWLDLELLSGRLSSGQIKLRLADYDKHSEARFIRPPFPSFDPVKDLEAENMKVRMGIKALQDVCLEQTGEEIQDVIAKRKQEREWLAAAGIPDVIEQEQGVSSSQVEDMGRAIARTMREEK
jgi:lambda family phage portal protein